MVLSKINFAGDVLLSYDKENECADIVLEDGMIKDCRDLATAVYLSLFGGGATKENDTWWGNSMSGTKSDEVLDSASHRIAVGAPMTANTLKKMQVAARDDLAWLVQDGYADEVDVQIFAENNKRVRLEVSVIKSGEEVFGESYFSDWSGE